MSNELEQLKLSYETLGMSPEEIAVDRGLELVAVKAGLMQSSVKYRRDCSSEDEEEDDLNFTKQDLRDVNAVIKRTALCSEDERLAFQAACYIREDKKGRKDVNKAVGSMQFNILQFNQAMSKVREIKQEVINV